MFNDFPDVEPHARMVLLTSLALNTTVFLVSWSATLSADGVAAFFLAHALFGAVTWTLINFFVISVLSQPIEEADKKLNYSVKFIAFIMALNGFATATIITRGYVSITLSDNQQALDKCAIELLDKQTIADRLVYSAHSYFVLKDLQEGCGLK